MTEKIKKESWAITEMLFESVTPILERLTGAEIMITQLSTNIGKDKNLLWETIYNYYPKLKGKQLIIDFSRKQIRTVPKKKRS